MGSHSVTCHPTEVRIPPLPPAEAGTRFSDPGRMQGWVDLCCMKAYQPGIKPRPVSRKSNDLLLSHNATQCFGNGSVSVPILVRTPQMTHSSDPTNSDLLSPHLLHPMSSYNKKVTQSRAYDVLQRSGSSSEPSAQSASKSHCQRAGIHCPLWHVNSSTSLHCRGATHQTTHTYHRWNTATATYMQSYKVIFCIKTCGRTGS